MLEILYLKEAAIISGFYKAKTKTDMESVKTDLCVFE